MIGWAALVVLLLLVVAWFVRRDEAARDARKRNGLDARHRKALDSMYGEDL